MPSLEIDYSVSSSLSRSAARHGVALDVSPLCSCLSLPSPLHHPSNHASTRGAGLDLPPDAHDWENDAILLLFYKLQNAVSPQDIYLDACVSSRYCGISVPPSLPSTYILCLRRISHDRSEEEEEEESQSRVTCCDKCVCVHAENICLHVLRIGYIYCLLEFIQVGYTKHPCVSRHAQYWPSMCRGAREMVGVRCHMRDWLSSRSLASIPHAAARPAPPAALSPAASRRVASVSICISCFSAFPRSRTDTSMTKTCRRSRLAHPPPLEQSVTQSG